MFLDTVFIKRKRHKKGGETSPQNILNLTHDEDSSEYLFSKSNGGGISFFERLWFYAFKRPLKLGFPSSVFILMRGFLINNRRIALNSP